MIKRVLFVLDGTYPMDVRVQKEIAALEGEVEVHLMCAKNSKNTHEFISNFFFGPSTRKISKGFREILISLFGTDPFMSNRLRTIVKNGNFDIIHVHDLPQFKTVYKISSRFEIPLILDLHENFPEALDTWFQWRKSKIIRFKNKLLFNSGRWKKKERFAVEHADHVIAVVEEMKNKLLSEFNVDDSKITIITNSEDPSFFDEIEVCDLPFEEETFNVLYTGGIGPHRGLDDVILALGELERNETANVVLHIFGSGHRDNIAHLKTLVNENKIDHRVFFHSPVPLKSIPYLMRNADLNIIPHKSNGHCNNTVPHKLYHGLLSKRPLLVSNSAPLLRITQNGVYAPNFDAGQHSSCAIALKNIIEDHRLYMSKASESEAYFSRKEHSWDSEAIKLKSLYSTFN